MKTKSKYGIEGRTRFTRWAAACLGVAVFAPGLLASEITFTETYTTYKENFSTLRYGTDQLWVDGQTLPGWYYRPSFEGDSATEAKCIYTHGPNGTPGLQLFTSKEDPPSLRSLGSLTNGGLENGYWVSSIAYGFCIKNDTNSVIDAITVSFDQLQWYGGTGAAGDKVVFSYSTNATDLESGDWTEVPALNLRDFEGSAEGAITLATFPRTATLENLKLQVGQTIWLRWSDLQAEAGGNAGAGLSNLKVSAQVPAKPGTKANARP